MGEFTCDLGRDYACLEYYIMLVCFVLLNIFSDRILFLIPKHQADVYDLNWCRIRRCPSHKLKHDCWNSINGDLVSTPCFVFCTHTCYLSAYSPHLVLHSTVTRVTPLLNRWSHSPPPSLSHQLVSIHSFPTCQSAQFLMLSDIFLLVESQ